jgi:hypothetical protein
MMAESSLMSIPFLPITWNNLFTLYKGIIAFSLLSLPTTALGQEPIRAPVLIKFNDYYLLYSSPVSPFISEQGRIIVPLKVISQVLGIEVIYHRASGSATIKGWGKVIDIVADSKIANLGDQAVFLDVPVQYSQPHREFLVPIRFLLNSFGFSFEWDGEHRLLTILHENLIQDPDITSTFSIRIPSFYQDTSILIPTKIKLSDDHLLSLSLENVSETSLAKDSQGLFVMAKRPAAITIAGPDTYVSADTGDRASNPCINVGRDFFCSIQLDGTPDYVVARVMLRL